MIWALDLDLAHEEQTMWDEIWSEQISPMEGGGGGGVVQGGCVLVVCSSLIYTTTVMAI